MSRPANEAHEPVTVTDKRRIDPQTGELREQASGGPAPGGPPPGGPVPDAAAESDEATELKATLQRVKAEYDNYRKRSVRQEQMAADRAKAAVVSLLLPVLDDFDRARSHGDLESGPLRSVADKLTKALEGLGLSGFGDEGDDFDPSLHEAVQHEGDGSRPVVGSVLRRGYRLGDQVLRHAMVGVVDTVEDETDTSPEAAPADTIDNSDVSDSETAESESPAG